MHLSPSCEQARVQRSGNAKDGSRSGRVCSVILRRPRSGPRRMQQATPSGPSSFEARCRSHRWMTDNSKHSRGASAPEPCGVRSLSLPPTTRGSGAPRGASNQCPRRTCQCRHRPMRSGADARHRQVDASLLYAVRAPHLLSGALASRRSAAALATPVATSIGSAPGRVSWDPALAGVTRLCLSQSSALRADRSFCRTNGVQGRPGAGLRIPPAGAALAPASVRHRRRPSNERDGIGV